MRQLNYYHRSNDFKTTIFVTLALGAIYEGYKLLDHVGKKIIDKKMNPGNSKPDRVEEHRQMKQIDFEYMQKSEEYKRSLVESEVNKGKITTKINKLNDMIHKPHLQGEESMLVPGLIKLGDMCIIFSLPGTGKSALITQMAFGIDRGVQPYSLSASANIKRTPQPVIIYDAEQEEEDYQDRYGNGEDDYPDITIVNDCEFDNTDDFIEDLNEKIEDVAPNSNCTIIIDNISAICPSSNAKQAKYFFDRIKQVRNEAKNEGRYITFIIVAHTTKIDVYRSINLDSLAGSSYLARLFKNIMVLSKTKFGEEVKMLKVVKRRWGKMPSKVTLLNMKEKPYLHFEFKSEIEESEALPLRPKGNKDDVELEADDVADEDKIIHPDQKMTDHQVAEAIARVERKECTWNQIADEYGISRQCLTRRVKKYKQEHPKK